jgi:hypothetical protein
MRKFREGSMGAAEQKYHRRFRIGVAIVAALVLSAFFVFKTDMHDAVKTASRFCNVFGFIVTIIGFAVSGYCEEIADQFNWEGKGVASAGLGLVGLGLLISTGFNV